MVTPEAFVILSNNNLPSDSNQDPLAFAVDQNCACSDTELTLALVPPTHLPQPHLHQASVYTQQLTPEFALACNPLDNSGPAILNQAAWALLDQFAQPQSAESFASPAQQHAIRQFTQLGLLEPVATQRKLVRGATKTLVAWLHTTNACNLRCTYCYIDKNEEPMAEATGYAAVDAILRSARQHGFSAVKLKYAGGEATLNFGLVMKLHEYATQQAQQMGLTLKEVVLSNGVALTRPMLAFLREHNITLSISLDGIGAGHDQQRIFANGRGSAHLVTRSIDRALAAGVAPHLSITITSQNADDVADAVSFALERNLLFNLNFYRDGSATQSQAELRAEDERLIVGLRQVFARIERNLPPHSLLASLVDRANFAGAHETACGAGHSYLVVNQHGQVARCQMEIEQPVTDIFAHDPLGEIRLYDKGFQNSSVETKEGCRDCHWRYWCAGGCPVLTYRVTGRNDVKSPYCNVYKAIYPELLRLEGLRLLQWHNRLSV